MTQKNLQVFPSKLVRHWISMPFIFLPFLPTLFLHLCVELYHRVAFPLYGLSYVPITHYISFEREKLSYVRGLQKLYCLYCSYMNGVFAYFVAVAGKTEEYWCNLKHPNKTVHHNQPHQKHFTEPGDECAFQQKLKERDE